MHNCLTNSQSNLTTYPFATLNLISFLNENNNCDTKIIIFPYYELLENNLYLLGWLQTWKDFFLRCKSLWMHDLLYCHHDKSTHANYRRITIPVSPWFVRRRILLFNKEGRTRRKSLQVELRHVRHSEIDWTVVPEKEKRNIL